MKSRLLWLAAALAAAWLSGFAWFVASVEWPSRAAAAADGIVVLTGGADRVAEGVRLLREGRGRALLISGVGRGVELPLLAREAGVTIGDLAPRITLGHVATSTAGNADETAAWVRAERLRSLLVVTASYHMMRAMTELQRDLPAVRLIPEPVLPPALRGAGFRLATLRLLAHEYTKWLAAELGLTRLNAEPGRAAAIAARAAT
jgi:uncharacterized SAM-binding protein YcdF (DUF218 family)